MNEGSVETRVSRFLARYRIAPQNSIGVSPAELLLGRKPRSRLDWYITGPLKNVPCEKEKQVMQAVSEMDPSGCLEF